MKLIVGLGNPGKKYERTRHNIGFLTADLLADDLTKTVASLEEGWQESKKGRLFYRWFGNKEEGIEIIKPQTFMNNVGTVMKYIVKKHPDLKLENLYVVHDDLDIALGVYKLQFGKGPKTHNGLLDIYEKLGTKNFWHVRIGVDNRERGNRISGEAYVLQEFSATELETVKEVTKKVVEDLKNRLVL